MQTLILEPHGPVLLVRLNRPEALNALNQQMMAELTQALTQADALLTADVGFFRSYFEGLRVIAPEIA